jgi:hypothetical protein
MGVLVRGDRLPHEAVEHLGPMKGSAGQQPPAAGWPGLPWSLLQHVQWIYGMYISGSTWLLSQH